MFSLSMTSSFVVAYHSVADDWSSLPSPNNTAAPSVTRVDVRPTNTTTTTPLVGLQRPAASPFSPSTTSPSPTTIRGTYVRGHRIQQADRSQPEMETGRSTHDGKAVERPDNRTTRSRDDSADGLRRRKLHISAAQVSLRYQRTLQKGNVGGV